MTSADLAEIPAEHRAGVAEDIVTIARDQWARAHRRPRALSAREALLALVLEAQIVWIIGCDLQAGKDMSPEDWDRFLVALRRIDGIVSEAAG